jgi:signal transduction histidine kinase/ligand-binding sensor domain-containing protein/CheY-like chemotaxis protein
MKPKISLIAAFLLCSLGMLAQNIIRINSENGLPQNVVNSISQDAEGYIWITTEDGLCRYDGYHFNVYQQDAANPSNIRDNNISAVLACKNGEVWIATPDGLSRYNKLKDGFEHFLSNNIDFSNIISIAGAGKQQLWLSTGNGKIGLFDTKTGLLKIHPVGPALKLRSTSLIYQDSRGELWVGTNNQGLANISLKNNKPSFWATNSGNAANYYVRTLVEDAASNIWIGTYNGLCVFERKSQKVKWFNLSLTLPDEIRQGCIYSLYVDKKGVLWIGTQQDGLFKADAGALLETAGEKGILEHFTTGNPINGISHRSINTITEDKDNNIWIGTYSAGINIISPQQRSFENLLNNLEQQIAVPTKKFWGMCEDQLGRVWLGSDGGGLYCWNKKDNTVKRFVKGQTAGKLNDNAILSAYCDAGGELWFGTFQGGLQHFSPAKNSFENFPEETARTQTMDVREIFEDSHKNFWISCNGVGLWLFDRKAKRFVSRPAIGSHDVRAIDEYNGLWLACHRDGLIYFNPQTQEVKRWEIKPLGKKNAPNLTIYDVAADKKRGKIWLGTRFGGLAGFDLKTSKIEFYTEKDGLINNTIQAIVLDDKSNLWISTNNGISMFDPERKQFFNFGTEEGVPSGEFVSGSKCVLRDGYFCFGGANGICYFSPASIDVNKIPAKPALFDLKIYNQSIRNLPGSGLDADSGRFAGFPDAISLAYNENFVAIDFGTIDMLKAANIQYSFILEGLEGKWNLAGKRRTAYYSNLSPGTYTFKVKASFQGIYWSLPAEVKIRVNPPFWKRWWAYMVYGLIVAGLFTLILRYYRHRVLLEHELGLARQNQELQEKVFRDKMVFYNNLSHELRTPLTLILSPLEEILFSANLEPGLKSKLKLIYNNSKKLFGFINSLLTFSKAEEGSMKLHVSLHQANDHIQDIVNSFQPYAQKQQIRLNAILPDDHLNAWYDKEKLEIILYNLISNAIKFTPKLGLVNIKMYQQAKYVFIEVSDNGPGIAEDKRHNLFKRFYRIGGVENIEGTGIGLALTRSLIELHKAEIEVISQLGEGTTFRVKLTNDKSIYSVTELASGDETVRSFVLAEEMPEHEEEPATSVGAKNRDEKLRTLLIVEDNLEMQQYLAESFAGEFNITTADNGLIAMDLLESGLMPDLIITDIMMPEMDGITFARRVKTTDATSHLPILMLTAKTGLEQKLEGFAAGALDYIAKPFNLRVLKAKVAGLVNETVILKEYFRKKVLLEPSVSKAISNEEKILAKMKTIIEENLENSDFNVNILVEKMAMSHSALFNKIKLFTDLSLNEFIRSCRLQRAAQLIAETDLSISEITYSVGFNDLKYFRECFRKEFNMSPSEYKKSKAIAYKTKE